MNELRYKYQIQDILATDNVAELVESEDLRLIGGSIVDNYDADKATRSEWEERIEEALDLALQVVEEKSTPWPGAANVKYPLLSTAALQFSARAYPALVPGFNVVKGRVLGYDPDGTKTAKSIRISKHMSYQVLEEMPDWEEEMDKLTMILPILGTVFKKTYYDELAGRNRSELVLPSDLVVDYWAKNLEDAHRKTHVLNMSKNDIYERVTSKIFLDVDLGEPAQPEPNEGQERAGLTPSNTTTNPHTILEQHTYLDLDGDGYEEPYIVTVHEDSGEVLRIVKRYDENSISFLGDTDVVLKISPIEYFTKFGFIPYTINTHKICYSTRTNSFGDYTFDFTRVFNRPVSNFGTLNVVPTTKPKPIDSILYVINPTINKVGILISYSCNISLSRYRNTLWTVYCS